MQQNLMQPETRAALRALAARRRRVLLARGAFAIVLSLLAAMAAVATVDRFVVMSDSMRIGLSLLGYATVVATLWLTSLRFLLRWPSEAELARLIEQASPELREDLVSAVELSSDGSETDSQAFREVLQRNVGKRVSRIDPQAILPWRLVAWWAGVSTGAVVLTAMLLLTPGLRYGEMLTRAMLPIADRDRVSSTRITLLDPSPEASGKVPMNERVPVRVRVEGGTFDKVDLEVDRGEAGHETLRFASTRVEHEYTIDLPVTDQPLRFRVAAGDGLTRYFELDPTARPHIKQAALATTPPAYTGFAPTQSTGTLGEIKALQGSLVDLVLTADQPIQEAELRLELQGERSAISLIVDPADPTRLRASLPIERSGDYRVYLKAKDTGFDTPDSRRHEITAVPDELPRVTLDEPAGQLGTARDALVRITGSASDDVALAAVQQQTRINGSEWQSTSLQPTGQGQIRDALDLMGLKLSVGDEVELRLAATDRADNTAYSQSARLIVTPDGLRRIDAQALQSQRALLIAINQARAATSLYAEAVADHQAAVKQPRNTTARQQSLARVRSARLALSDTTYLLDQRITEALDRAVPGREAEHLVRIGRLASTLQTLNPSLDTLNSDTEVNKRISEKSKTDVEQLAQANALLSRMLLLDMTDAARQQLASLTLAIDQSRTQLKADQDIDPELADQRLQRRLIAIVAQANQALNNLTHATQLDNKLQATEDANKARETLAVALNQIEKVINPLGNDRGMMLRLLDDLQQAMGQSSGQTFQAVARAERDLRGFYDQQNHVLADAARALSSLQADLQPDSDQWAVARNSLQNHARIEEQSPDADRVFLSDLGQTRWALSTLADAAELSANADELRPKLAELVDALRTLERVHDVRVLRAMVAALANSESARSKDPGAAFRHRGDWVAIDTRFAQLPRRMFEVSELNEAAKIVESIQHHNDFRVTDTEFDRRLNEKHSVVTREEELARIVARLDDALAQAEAAEVQAREVIAEQAPSLPEQMRNLADRAEELSDQSRAAAQVAEQEPSGQSQQDAAQLSEKQQKLNEKLDDLSEQIRRQADQEDLLTEQGRERSRDADDAIAMLKPDAEEATRQLKDAQSLERPDLQAKAIDQAADAQERSAQTLRDLAEHFENLEENAPAAEQTRQALRDAERDLGLSEHLDAEYEKMERLAELAQADDAERLNELEQMLEQEPEMRRELDRISESLAEGAQQQLADAAAKEQQIADRLDERAERSARGREKQRKQQALEQLAKEAVEMERDQVRPLEDDISRDIPQAKPQVKQARESLRNAAEQARPDGQQQREQGDVKEQEQRIEEFAEQTRRAADAVKEAEKKAAEERDQQKQRAQDARRRADQAIREGRPDPQAAREIVEANRAAENAEQARQASARAERDVDQLADRAERLAEQSKRDAEQRERDLGQASQEQEQLAEQTQQSAEDLARAARHQERLGDKLRAEQLDAQAQDVGELAEQALPQTGQDIANAEDHKPAADAARDTAQKLQQQANQLAGDQHSARLDSAKPDAPQQGEAGQSDPAQGQPQQDQPSQADPQSGEPIDGASPAPPMDGAIAQQLARELDRLDAKQAANAEPANDGADAGQPSQDQSAASPPGQGTPDAQSDSPASQPSGASGQRPIDQAAQQQAQNIREARNPANQPGQPGEPGQGSPPPGIAQAPSQPNGSGAPENNGGELGPPQEAGELAEAPSGKSDWGDLPERIAEDLNQGARERAPAEYLDQVDAYFKAIAQRAQNDQTRSDNEE